MKLPSFQESLDRIPRKPSTAGDSDSSSDGAALVTLCEEPFDKDDAQGLARLHALEAALRPIQS